MTGFEFKPMGPPFAEWLGPYSPARGNRSGFRVHKGHFGCLINDDFHSAFRTVEPSLGVQTLTGLVIRHFMGGRVLLMPNGHVIKPLNRDEERGRRVIIGHWGGVVRLETDKGSLDFSDGRYAPATLWPGPSTIGLECVIDLKGALHTSWWTQTPTGAESIKIELYRSNRALASAFKQIRPEDAGGRVRVTAHGLVLTSRRERTEDWTCWVVGRVDPTAWPHQPQWVGGYIA